MLAPPDDWKAWSFRRHIKPLAIRNGMEYNCKFACPACNHQCVDQQALLNHLGQTGKPYHQAPGVFETWKTTDIITGQYLNGPTVTEKVGDYDFECVTVWVPTRSIPLG